MNNNITIKVRNSILLFFAIICLFLLSNIHSYGQTIPGMCPDSTLIRQGFFCDTANFASAYQPVCGCNNKTYFNVCAAQNYAGITTYQNGPCEAFSFILWPVPANTELNVVMAVKDLSTVVHVVIYGVANYQFCYENYYTFAYYPTGVNTFQIDVSTLSKGVYLVFAQTTDGSYFAVHKFVKMPTL